MTTIKMTRFDLNNSSGSQIARMARAERIAQSSSMRQKHGAILMQGSSVLAVAVNSQRNDPSTFAQWTDPTKRPNGISVHAEVAATKIHPNVPNTVLYICRVNLADSKPCPECISHLIWNTSVKEVIFS